MGGLLQVGVPWPPQRGTKKMTGATAKDIGSKPDFDEIERDL